MRLRDSAHMSIVHEIYVCSTAIQPMSLRLRSVLWQTAEDRDKHRLRHVGDIEIPRRDLKGYCERPCYLAVYAYVGSNR